MANNIFKKQSSIELVFVDQSSYDCSSDYQRIILYDAHQRTPYQLSLCILSQFAYANI